MPREQRKPMGRPPKPPGEKYPRVTITLPPDLLAAVDRIAAETGAERSGAIRELIERSLRARGTRKQ
jgi:metal-responsive CopG/Arc/MetJ family transcriptional regulator